MKTILKEAELSLINIHYSVHLSSLHWLLEQPVIIFNQTNLAKKNTLPLIYREKLFNIHERDQKYSDIYTDGSKDGNRSGSGTAYKNKTAKECLPKEFPFSLPKPAPLTLYRQATPKDWLSIPILFLYCYPLKTKKWITLSSLIFWTP